MNKRYVNSNNLSKITDDKIDLDNSSNLLKIADQIEADVQNDAIKLKK
jgi:hypothetical protein